MNNRLNELLTILQEECAEVSQAASKCIRFGMDSVYDGKTNRERLETELGDLMGMVKLIDSEHNLNPDKIIAQAEFKMVKVEKYMTNTITPDKVILIKPKNRPRRKSLKSN